MLLCGFESSAVFLWTNSGSPCGVGESHQGDHQGDVNVGHQAQQGRIWSMLNAVRHNTSYLHINLPIYIYIPSGTQVLRWPHTGCCPAADDPVVSCSATGQGGVGGGVGWGVLSFVECWSRCWCSAADDHVVSCSATGQGGVGGGVGCIIVHGMLITFWCSAADDHVVSSATGRGGVGCIIVRGMLITFWCPIPHNNASCQNASFSMAKRTFFTCLIINTYHLSENLGPHPYIYIHIHIHTHNIYIYICIHIFL